MTREVAAMGMSANTGDESREEKITVDLRIPKWMYLAARRLATKRGVSGNAWICDAIADKLDETGKILPFSK